MRSTTPAPDTYTDDRVPLLAQIIASGAAMCIALGILVEVFAR